MASSNVPAYLALIISSVIWGIASPVIKYTLNYLSPISFLYFRFLIVSIIMFIPIILRVRKIGVPKENIMIYIFLGLLCTPINLILFFVGIEKTTSMDASLINTISPILVVLCGAYFLKEKINNYEKAGTVLALIGTIFTLIEPLINNNKTIGSSIWGNFLVLLSALEWVYFIILTKKFHKDKIDPLLLTGFSFFLGFLIMLPLHLFEITKYPVSLFSLNTGAILGLLFMAVFSSAVAYFAYIYGLTIIEASKAGVFSYLQPVFAIPVSILILHEKLTLPFLAGAFLITVGVILCEHNSNSNRYREPPETPAA